MKWGKIEAKRVKIASKTRMSVYLTYFLSLVNAFLPCHAGWMMILLCAFISEIISTILFNTPKYKNNQEHLLSFHFLSNIHTSAFQTTLFFWQRNDNYADKGLNRLVF